MKIIACVYIALIALIIILANTGQLGPVAEIIRKVPYGDAVLHAVLMGMLALAVNILLQLKTISLGRHQMFLGSFLVVLFVIIEEGAQLFLANRTFSLIDLGADFIGIWLCGRLAGRMADV